MTPADYQIQRPVFGQLRRMSPTTALTNALVLAITAPDQARADRAIALAESISAGCTAKQVATAKRNALKLAK
jgi:hypothetical protein